MILVGITLFGRRRPIYVETLIRAPMDALWAHTQTPALHERWDLRFTSIDYLPKRSEDEPQRFRYRTRLGFGLRIDGTGESVGGRDLADGSRTSALRFGSDSRLSLIRQGSGYWKYVPTPDGIRFLTAYDYTTRFGPVGTAIDRAAFRPLIGWATAWSFDRLRRWLEDGLDPAQAIRQAAIHAVARIGLAVTFAYHGIVPKLLGPHPDEVAMLADAGIPASAIESAVVALGVLEVLFAALVLLAWRQRWVPVAALGFAVVATAVVAATSAGYLGAAFNPVTLNLGVACLALIDLIALDGLPSASGCRREPPSVVR